MTELQMQAMIERAGECGAKKALAAIGLHDMEAAADIRELRGVLDAWRSAKTTAINTMVKAITVAFMAAIVAALGMTWWDKK